MTGIPAPKKYWRRLLQEPYGYDVALAWFSLLGGSAGIILAFQRNPYAGWMLLVAVVGIFLFSVCKAFVQFRNVGRRDSTHELAGCLETLYALLSQKFDNDNCSGLRVTVHTPVKKGESFAQALDYVGDDRGGSTAGRVFPANAGVIGVCKTGMEVVYGSRENPIFSEYVSELAKNWNFAPEEARRKNQQTMSWLAVPLASSAGVLAGVVYLDSIRPGFFDDENLRKDVEMACVGIASFVAKRYQ